MIPHSRPSFTEREIQAVLGCLRTGMVNEGSGTAALEELFRARYGAAGATATGSGCQALWLALTALGIAPGDEVIVPTYVCAEVLGVVEAAGATARIVDVDDDYLISVPRTADAIGPKTRAIVVPYVLGMTRDMAALRALGIPVIEDFAQSITAPEVSLPAVGDLAVFSFEATKVVTGGEGGMVLAYREDLAGRLRAAKRYRDTPYKLNLYPLSDLQASLVRVQIERLPEMVARRRLLAQRYIEALTHLPGIGMPANAAGPSMFYRFPLRLAEPDDTRLNALIASFGHRGVSVRRPVDCLLHRLACSPGDYPVAERLYDCTLSIPLYPALTDQDQAIVIEACRALLAPMT